MLFFDTFPVIFIEALFVLTFCFRVDLWEGCGCWPTPGILSIISGAETEILMTV